MKIQTFFLFPPTKSPLCRICQKNPRIRTNFGIFDRIFWTIRLDFFLQFRYNYWVKMEYKGVAVSFYMKLRRFAKRPVSWLFRVRLKRPVPTLPEGNLVICANHFSYLDAILLAIECDTPVTYLAKESLFHKPLVGWVLRKCGCIPVAAGGQDAAALRQAVRLLKEGHTIMLFPQGTRVKDDYENTEAKKGVGMLLALAKPRVICFGLYVKNYKPRLFRKSFVVPGQVREYPIPEGISRREETQYLAEKVNEDLAALCREAREMA